LEKDLRLRLFDRLPTGTTLTDAGSRILARATRLLDAEAELRADTSASGPIEGTVRIGAPESLCGRLLPPVIAALQRRHPGVDVTLTPLGTADATEALRAGRVSAALVLEPSIDTSDLVIDRLGLLELAFVSGHRQSIGALTWPELAAWRWFLLEEGCAYSDEVARRLGTGTDVRLTRLGSVEATRACVAAGLGLAVLPSFAADERRLARFTAPPIPEPNILLARHRRRSPSRALAAVLAPNSPHLPRVATWIPGPDQGTWLPIRCLSRCESLVPARSFCDYVPGRASRRHMRDNHLMDAARLALAWHDGNVRVPKL
jgi:DNA-binding transcriptional LysR family regulator